MVAHNYAQYVHEYTGHDGDSRWAVGRWDQRRGQFIRPFDHTEAQATGCFAEYGRRPQAMQSYATRRQALRRARYLFGPESVPREEREWFMADC